jgi:sodium-independent sulfate anion transporter 11
MPVGGAMSRTAVNSDTGVKSPAYGIIAGGFVILSIFKLSPALYWIPKATLAAIVVTAVGGIIVPPKVFYGYWKTSLVDFIAAMLCFWLTLFVNSETGIGCAVGFNILYYLILAAFSRVKRITQLPDCRQCASEWEDKRVPLDTQVFKPSHSLLFANAFWIKRQCFDVVLTYNSGAVMSIEKERETRNWSVTGERRLLTLRSKAGIVHEPVPIRVVVLDFSNVHRIDTTGLVSLRDLKADLLRYGGEGVQLRFFNVRSLVKEAFERFGWGLVNDGDGTDEGEVVFKTLADAVWKFRGSAGRNRDGTAVEVQVVGDEKV